MAATLPSNSTSRLSSSGDSAGDIARAEQAIRAADQQLAQTMQQAKSQLTSVREQMELRKRQTMQRVRSGSRAAALVGGAALLLYAWNRRRHPSISAAKAGAYAAPASLLGAVIGALTRPGTLTMLLPLVSGYAARQATTADLLTVPYVDLRRYAGHWFELARLPNRYERQCASDVTAQYALVPGPSGQNVQLQVLNQCLQLDSRGRTTRRRSRGIARAVRGFGNARLQVSFAASWMQWMPWVWSEYWVIDLAEDYSSALVGSPNRKTLWILGRETTLPTDTMQRYIRVAQALGFAVDELQFTEHGAAGNAPGTQRSYGSTPTAGSVPTAGRTAYATEATAPGAPSHSASAVTSTSL